MREEKHGELDSLRVTASQRVAAIVNVRHETSAEETKVPSERDRAAPRYLEVMVPIRSIVEAREKRMGNAAGTLARRVASRTSDLGSRI